MPINAQPIKPTSGMTSGAGLATTLNSLIERSNVAVVLVNKNEAGIGDLTKLKSDDKSSLVNALNELTVRLENGDLIADYVGLLRDLNTQNKNTIVQAINEVNNNVGPMSLLEVPDVTSVVGALNYLNEVVGQLGDIGNGDFDNIIDALNSKVAKAGDRMTGALKFEKNNVNAELFVGNDNTVGPTANSLEVKANAGIGLYPLIAGGAGSIPLGEASHYFDTSTGDATFRGTFTVMKDIEGRADIMTRGTRIGFRNSSGGVLGTVRGTAEGIMQIVTAGSQANTFSFNGASLILPADPTQDPHAATKRYVDKRDSDFAIYSDETFYKKTGGPITGNVSISGNMYAEGSGGVRNTMTIRQHQANSIPGIALSKFEDNAELAYVYYNPANNQAIVRVGGATGGASKQFSFGPDGNLTTANVVPTDDAHLTAKKYVDEQIAFVRQRPNQLGTQKMNTIEDAGALATKNKVDLSDMNVTGTASATSALFGDGTWKELALDADNFVKTNVTETQEILSSLNVKGNLKQSGSNLVVDANTRWAQLSLQRDGKNKGVLFVDTENAAGNMLVLRSHHSDPDNPAYKEFSFNGNTGGVSLPNGLSVGGSVASGDGFTATGANVLKFDGLSNTGVGAMLRLRANGGASGQVEFGTRTGGEAYIYANAGGARQWTFNTNGTFQSAGDVFCTNLQFTGRVIAANYGERSRITMYANQTHIRYGDDNVMIIGGDNNSLVSIGQEGAPNRIQLYGDGGQIYCAYLNSSGEVYAGTTVNGNYLHSRGSIRALGEIGADGNVWAYSDVRIKYDIKPIEGALDKIKRMEGKTFRKDKFDRTIYGFIAQEVEEIVPELVMETDDVFKEGERNILQLDASHGFEALLVEAVKELSEKIDRLEEENRILKERVFG
nr:tail fiber protein [Ochrobactrum phage ORM_20]